MLISSIYVFMFIIKPNIIFTCEDGYVVSYFGAKLELEFHSYDHVNNPNKRKKKYKTKEKIFFNQVIVVLPNSSSRNEK